MNKVFVVENGVSRDATWQEAYGMVSMNHSPSTETVRYVHWLEGRIKVLEERLKKVEARDAGQV